MKKNEKKYLKLYEEWIDSGLLPGGNGLCRLFRGDPMWELMEPPEEVRRKLVAWWASGKTEDQWRKASDKGKRKIEEGFTGIRQNIVLLMAAMNGEL